MKADDVEEKGVAKDTSVRFLYSVVKLNMTYHCQIQRGAATGISKGRRG